MITDKHREQLFGSKPKVFATIIPFRVTKGAVALHSTIGQAKSAVSCQSYGGEYVNDEYVRRLHEAEIYQLIDGEWTLIARIEKGTLMTDLPWKK